jgi:hypothetical protein
VKQRGRKGAAALSVVAGTINAVERPEPPAELTAEQAWEWQAIVDRMPADWFTVETWPVLMLLCRHICVEGLVFALV